MNENDIEEAVWRVIAARLATDVMRLTDADVIGEDAVRRHCLVAARALRAGIRQCAMLDLACAKGGAAIQYGAETV